MSEVKLPEGAPEEVITKAILREIDLTAFGATGTLSLITLDNGMDHNRPNTFGPASLYLCRWRRSISAGISN